MEFLQAPVLGVAAGLNPYVTVALTSLFAWRSDFVTPNPAFEFVGTSAVFLVALLLLPIDLFADKFPGSGGLMDRVGWVLRPVAGGLAGAAVMPDHPAAIVGGLALGAVAAAGIHGLRLHLRRRLQWRMLGFGRLVLGAYADLTQRHRRRRRPPHRPRRRRHRCPSPRRRPPRRPPLGRAGALCLHAR